MLTGVGVEGRFVDDGELVERKIWSEERDDEVVVAEKGPVVGAGPEFDPSVTP